MLTRFARRPLVREISLYGAAELAHKSLPIVLLPVLTHYLSPSDYGIVATFTAYVGVLSMLVGLSTHGAVTVHFFKQPPDHVRGFVVTTIVLIGAIAVLVAVAVALARQPLSAYLGLSLPWLLGGVVVAQGQGVVAIRLAIWQCLRQPVRFGSFRVANLATDLGLSVWLVVASGLAWRGRALAIIAAATVFAVLAADSLRRFGYLTARPSRAHTATLLRFGVPLVPNSISIWLNTGADIILVAVLVGQRAAGEFSVALQIGTALALVGATLHRAFEPRAYQMLAAANPGGRTTLVRQTYALAAVVLLAAVLMFALAPWLIVRLLDPAYAPAAEYVPWLLTGFVFKALQPFVSLYLFYEQRTRLFATITLLSGLAHITMSYLLITRIGAMGAAVSTGLTYMVTFAAVVVAAQRTTPLPWLTSLWSPMSRSRAVTDGKGAQ